MKRIVALILALACMLALASCDNTEGGGDHAELDVFKAAILATSPSRATINITYTDTNLGVSLDGNYIAVYNEDGTATVSYEYDRLNGIDSDSEEMISTLKGTATVKADGTVSGDLDEKVSAAAEIKINLDPAKMTYTVAKGVLTAGIKAADVKDVIGVDLGADVSMTITLGSGRIGSVSYSYAVGNGIASVVCFYE